MTSEAGVGAGRGSPPVEPVTVEQRRPATQVGPAAVLDGGDDDEVPLEPLGPVGGEQPDSALAGEHALVGRLGRDLLRLQLVEQLGDAGPRPPLLEPRHGVEQRDHGVEVAVGGPALLAALGRGA